MRITSSPPSSRLLDVSICTFGILALELGLIRWISGQIRIVAYFTNLILLAAFLGMGLGVALGRRRPGLVHLALPALALLSAVLASADSLGLVQLQFPDPSMFLWGVGNEHATLLGFAGVTLLIAAIFWAVAAVFALAASPLGRMFDQLPALRAYTWDIAGSLAGIVAVTLASALGASPWQWMALGVLPILWLSRTPVSMAAAVATLVLAGASGLDAYFSPYNRIDLQAAGTAIGPAGRQDWEMYVNRDYHQRMLDLSNARVAADSAERTSRAPFKQQVYELPFRLRPQGKRALVVGAGTGNDLAAALRAGFTSVTAVEIDPTIIRLGRQLHPEDPYGSPAVHVVNDDARAFFERTADAKFDVVTYGLVDSHSMFSAMSSLRLDNYVYTVEGIRAGWSHVAANGVLAISFSTYAGPWIEQRLLATVRQATGLTPMLVRHRMDYGAWFVVGQEIDRELIPSKLRTNVVMHPEVGASVRVPTDDWPFLYLRPHTPPTAYLTVLLIIAVTAPLAIRRAYGRRADVSSAPASSAAGLRFDTTMFLMGAGFMLLETRMVTELSLLFGSTWIVNACVFGGVLVMVLLANLWVSWRPPVAPGRWFIPLAASVAVTWAVGAGTLNVLGIAQRGIVGGILFALPIGFAGIIVATLLARSTSRAVALGSNLLGAVLGGLLEYSSMFFGLRLVAILALVCYVGAFWSLVRSQRKEATHQNAERHSFTIASALPTGRSPVESDGWFATRSTDTESGSA